MACRVHTLTKPTESFPMIARAASLVGCGAIGKACKLAYSFGTEADLEVATTFGTPLDLPNSKNNTSWPDSKSIRPS